MFEDSDWYGDIGNSNFFDSSIALPDMNYIDLAQNLADIGFLPVDTYGMPNYDSLLQEVGMNGLDADAIQASNNLDLPDSSPLLGYTPNTELGYLNPELSDLLTEQGLMPVEGGVIDQTGAYYTPEEVPFLDPNQLSAPPAMSIDPRFYADSYMKNFPVGSFLEDDRDRVAQSYLDRNGEAVSSPYDYVTGPSGDTFITDTRNGNQIGWLDDSLNNRYYADVARENGARPFQVPALSLSKGGSSSGKSSGSSNQKSTTKDKLQGGLNMAANAAKILKILTEGGKVNAPDARGNRGANAMRWMRF